MVNSADPDQLAFSEASWSTLFAKAGQIQVQQDYGYGSNAVPYFTVTYN